MPSITDDVKKLVEQGITEAALETLANWLRTEQSLALNEVIFLRSRYEQVVQGDSFKDGEVYFLIPKDLRKADLRIKFYEEYTVLPVQW